MPHTMEQTQDQLILKHLARSLNRFATAREGSDREREAAESIAEKALHRLPTEDEIDKLLASIR